MGDAKGDGKPSYKRKGDAKGGDSKAKQPKILETHQEMKARTKHRKGLRTHAEVMDQMKVIWNQLRVQDVDVKERQRLIKELRVILLGSAMDIIQKHDGARVVECYLKFAEKQGRVEMIDELTPHLLPLVKGMYSKFVAQKMIKFASNKQRVALVAALKGKVRSLVSHREAAAFVDTLFSDYCNTALRRTLVEEFYGPHYAVFNTTKSTSLGQVLDENPDKKQYIMKFMLEALTPILNKSNVTHSIVHRVILEYLQNCDDAARADMIVLLKELLPEMIHTKDGAHVGILCVQKGTPKDRKGIIKALKPFADRIAKEEYGFVVLCAIFDNVDDTVLVGKSILSQLVEKLQEILDDKNGRKVIIYLLQDRKTSSVLNPDVKKILEAGDGNKFSKKDWGVRAKELVKYVRTPLLDLARDNLRDWMDDYYSCWLLGEILLHCTSPEDGTRQVFVECADVVEKEVRLLENMEAHRFLKRMVKEDQPAAADSKADGSEPFAVLLANRLKDIPDFVVTSQGGAFVLLALIESTHAGASKTIKKTLVKGKAAKALNAVKTHNAGSRLLAKALSS